MKALIQDEPMTFGLKVWLYDESPEGRMVYNADGSVREVVTVESADVEPSLTIHDQALAALVKAGSEIVPPSRSMEEHLEDARYMRDRLLDLVEHNVKGPAS